MPDKFHDDNELVAKIRVGDVEAFDQAYHKYAGRLYLFALKYLKSEEEAEELVQSVYLKLWENRKGLKADTSFKSYLFTIAYHEICNLFRKRVCLKKFVREVVAVEPISSLETEQQIDFQFVQEHVNQLIVNLPDRLRIIFIKSRQEGKSTREIAAELGLSPGTVDNCISEAIKIIRQQLKSEHISVVLYVSLFFQFV